MIAANRAKWEAEYPSDSPTITVLREAVIRAEAQSLDSQFAFDGLDELLRETEIPTYEWPEKVYQCFQTLKRADAADARHLARALRTLQTAYAAHQSAVAKLPPPPPEPKPPAAPRKPDMQQVVRIKVENGQIRHQLTNYPWGKADSLAGYRYVRRHFEFKDLQVPEAYAWVNTYNGFTGTAPCTSYTIYYTGEEFARIVQLEQDSGSDLLIEGNRCGYITEAFDPALDAMCKLDDIIPPWEEGWDW